MLNKDEFLSTHPDVHTGMDAYSVDGEKLGEVERLDNDSVTIEKGWFFPRDFTIRYDDIVDIREDHVVVSRSRADLEGWRDEGYSGWDEYDQANRETRRQARQEDETRIPIREEELEAEKRQRQGDVRLRKATHTEAERLRTPGQKEDTKVERHEPKRTSR
jgi:stress response protein YsnF